MSVPLLFLRTLAAAGLCAALAGCATLDAVGYYWQSVRGHMQLMHT